jgi:tryptophan-rich sensory protein
MPSLGPRLVKTQEAHLKIRIITWLLFYACTLVAAAGAFWFVGDLNANSWIAPSIAPPAWIFGPVWTILYLMIATSGYRIFHAKYSAIKGIALVLSRLSSGLFRAMFAMKEIENGKEIHRRVWA